MFLYNFDIIVYNELDDCKDRITGIACGESYINVVESLVNAYGGSDIIEFKSLKLIEDSEYGILEETYERGYND